MKITALALRCSLTLALLSAPAINAQSAAKGQPRLSDKDKLIGAWHLVQIDSPGPDGKSTSVTPPIGMLIYTRDGHISVQLMYPKAARDLSNESVMNGYEASFGTYDVNQTTHILTHHIEGANTGDRLVGKDLPRIYRVTPDGHLVIRSANPEEHWSVTWEHY